MAAMIIVELGFFLEVSSRVMIATLQVTLMGYPLSVFIEFYFILQKLVV